MILACSDCIDLRSPESLQGLVGPFVIFLTVAVIAAFLLVDLASRSSGRARLGALALTAGVLLVGISPVPLGLEHRATIDGAGASQLTVLCGKALIPRTDLAGTTSRAAAALCEDRHDVARRQAFGLAATGLTLGLIGAILLVSSRGRGLVQQQKPFSFRPVRGSHWTQSSLR